MTLIKRRESSTIFNINVYLPIKNVLILCLTNGSVQTRLDYW